MAEDMTPPPERADGKPWAQPTQPPPGLMDTQSMSAMAPKVMLAWFRKEFSRVSLFAIGSILITCGGYFIGLTVSINNLEHKLESMNERIPTGDTNQRANEEISHVREQVAGLVEKTAQQEKHLDYTDEQIQHIYSVFDPDAVASMRPFSKRNRK